MNRTVVGAALVVALSPFQLVGAPPATASGEDLVAKHVTAVSAELPASATANPATTALTGTRSWGFFPENQSSSAVSNLSVSVDSGLDPTQFYWAEPVSGFPVTRSKPELPAGQGWDADGGLQSTVPVNFVAGYDSTRTVNPPAIKVGGDQQTVTISVTPQAAAYATVPGQFLIFVRSALPGVTLVPGSGTLPDNLDQGEQASTLTGTDALIAWQLSGDRPQIGETYTFTAKLGVPNTFGVPFDFSPMVSLRGTLETTLSPVPGSTATFTDASLDGASPGVGTSTFTVTEGTHVWARLHDQAADVTYREQAPGNDLIVRHETGSAARLVETAESSPPQVSGIRYWQFGVENRSTADVTDLTVAVSSGHDPGLFWWGGPVAGFPATQATATLAAGQSWDADGLWSDVPVSFAPGFNSTRTVDPLRIPVGGTQQQVTVSITPTDPDYDDADLMGWFNLELKTDAPGVTLVSAATPTNLDQGEEVYQSSDPGSLIHWELGGDRPHAGKTYTFTATLNVSNANGVPIEFRPELNVSGALEGNLSGATPGQTVNFTDSTLDGATPGQGGSQFTVAGTDHWWTLLKDTTASLNYPGTLKLLDPDPTPSQPPAPPEPAPAPSVPPITEPGTPVVTQPATAPGPGPVTVAQVPVTVTGFVAAFPKKKRTVLTWNSSTGATGYRVRVSKRNSAKKFSAWKTTTTATLLVKKLKKKGTYRVQITATGPGGVSPTATFKFKQKK